jgi:hypothetical protein
MWLPWPLTALKRPIMIRTELYRDTQFFPQLLQGKNYKKSSSLLNPADTFQLVKTESLCIIKNHTVYREEGRLKRLPACVRISQNCLNKLPITASIGAQDHYLATSFTLK